MGYHELIESLNRDADEKIAVMQKDVESKAEKIKSDMQLRAGQLRKEFSEKQSKAIKEQEETALKSAEKRAMIIRLSAEKALSDRLFVLSMTLLHELRDDGYENLFGLLARELPTAKWKCIRANPDDSDIARKLFPGSEFVSDNQISGGLEAISEDERICITNTFEKRLERIREEILPLLIKDIYKEVSDHGTSSTP